MLELLSNRFFLIFSYSTFNLYMIFCIYLIPTFFKAILYQQLFITHLCNIIHRRLRD